MDVYLGITCTRVVTGVCVCVTGGGGDWGGGGFRVLGSLTHLNSPANLMFTNNPVQEKQE